MTQESFIELAEYKGFNISEYGEIAVSINKNCISLSNNLNFLLLNRQEHNDYYPEPYLAVCFELELEGAGNTKEDTLEDLYQLLNLYYNKTLEIYGNPIEYNNVINENISQENLWKQSLLQKYNIAQKSNIINSNYKYQIS